MGSIMHQGIIRPKRARAEGLWEKRGGARPGDTASGLPGGQMHRRCIPGMKELLEGRTWIYLQEE